MDFMDPRDWHQWEKIKVEGDPFNFHGAKWEANLTVDYEMWAFAERADESFSLLGGKRGRAQLSPNA